MKKFFSLLTLLCLLGISAAKADITVNFHVTGMPNAFEHLHYNDNPMSFPNSFSSDNEPLTVPSNGLNLFIKADDNYKITQIQSSVQTITENNGPGSTGYWTYMDSYECYQLHIDGVEANNDAHITIIVNEDNGSGGGSENQTTTYEIPVTITPDDVVARSYFLGQPVTDNTIVAEYDASNPHASTTGYFTMTFANDLSEEDFDLTESKAYYTVKDSEEEVKLNLSITETNAQFELDFTLADAVFVNFVLKNDAPLAPETYSLNFAVAGASGLADPYKYLKVTKNGEAVDLTGASFSMNFATDTTTVVIAPVANYEITQYRVSPESKSVVTVENADGSLTVKFVSDEVESNISYDIMVGAVPVEETFVPVTFDVKEYPGLIARLGWNGVNTTVANDTVLNNYKVAFTTAEEGVLTITFATDSVQDQKYLVSKVNVATTTDAGVTNTTGTLTADASAANVTIAKTAKSVAISFVAEENIKEPSAIETIGVNSDEEVIYNLQGVRVNRENLRRGIYIINGRKVMIK